MGIILSGPIYTDLICQSLAHQNGRHGMTRIVVTPFMGPIFINHFNVTFIKPSDVHMNSSCNLQSN